MARAVCTPAVPAPNMRNRPVDGLRRRASPDSHNRAIVRLAPTSKKKIRGCKTPRLRGTQTHCCIQCSKTSSTQA